MVKIYTHPEARRRNIPTAENQGIVNDGLGTVNLLHPRNVDLDPQLVWKGKDAEDFDRYIEVNAPPIYIQEKIQPRAIIEDLRSQTKERRPSPSQQTNLFDDFNGLPEGWRVDALESYYHDEGNWSNRMILGDSLLVMASLAERESVRGKIQLIYIDPPYGIRFNSNWQPSTKTRDVKDGRLEGLSREPEVVRAFRDTWKNGIHSYLSYMRDRVTLARELLTDSGSIFVQIGDENVHRVRSVLDEVFSPDNFVAEIAFTKGATGLGTSDRIPTRLDYLLWYCKKIDQIKFHQLYNVRSQDRDHAFMWAEFGNGFRRRLTAEERAPGYSFPSDARFFQDVSLTKPGPGAKYEIAFEGNTYNSGSRWWGTPKAQLERACKSGRIIKVGSALRQIRFQDETSISAMGNLWDGLLGQSDPTYVVQTNVEVVKRCLLMTTDPGDLVLDPTCGSGTTAYVAEQWGRRWITIDTSRVALTLARARLMGSRYDYYLLKDSKDGAGKEGEITGKPPSDGPYTNNIRHGFVYERVPHVTLKSIANNAEIDVIWERWRKTLEPLREKLNSMLKQAWEEWEIPRDAGQEWPAQAKKVHEQWWKAHWARQKEIDESITRNADVEFLYDRPYKARGVVRVAGPFTVESLSPHRVLPMGEDPYLEELLLADEHSSAITSRAKKVGVDGRVKSGHDEKSGPVITDFAQVVYENLKAAGVQNTKKGETLKFEWLKPFASRSGLIQFEGRYQEKGESKRAAVCIGPEYDTVGYDLVRRAAREAADLFDTLIICGFAFAPEVDDTRLNFGSLTVLKARMNQDLRMADKLKATGAGNLFVVFGEPDVVIHKLKDGMLKVEIRGMDIFDPTTGEVRSSGGKDLMNDVAAWFIDNDYDEDSFFVRQAYFVGDDPYDGLKRALKADIDETAWAELNSTVSRPFPRPKHGRICVKVINHFGDEVQKVFQV
jgi:adenine-specific DNA-methyltransferase